MTNEEKQFLSQFESRVRQLLLQYKQLEEDNEELRKALNERDEKIVSLESELAHQKSEYATLKLARMIAIGDKEMHDAKKRISKLVREVDNCIALLKA